MASGKARAQNALAVRITAGCSIQRLDGERSKLSRIRDKVESLHAAGSPEHGRLCEFIGEIGQWIDVKGAAQATLKDAKSALKADLSGQVAFLANHTISGGCTRGNVVRVIDAHDVLVRPVNYVGFEKKEKEFIGRDAEGNEKYKSVSIEETVPRRWCMQGSIEDVKALRKAVASAIANCEGIGAKGELDELRDVSRTLEHGRSGPPARHARRTRERRVEILPVGQQEGRAARTGGGGRRGGNRPQGRTNGSAEGRGRGGSQAAGGGRRQRPEKGGRGREPRGRHGAKERRIPSKEGATSGGK